MVRVAQPTCRQHGSSFVLRRERRRERTGSSRRERTEHCVVESLQIVHPLWVRSENGWHLQTSSEGGRGRYTLFPSALQLGAERSPHPGGSAFEESEDR